MDLDFIRSPCHKKSEIFCLMLYASAREVKLYQPPKTSNLAMPHELQSKLLVSPVITPVVEEFNLDYNSSHAFFRSRIWGLGFKTEAATVFTKRLVP